MAKSEKTERKQVKESGIFYEAWTKKELEQNPITEKHVGAPISVASDPRKRKYILGKIHKPGEKMYPDGGYEIDHPDFVFSQSLFLEEAKSFKPKKKKKK